MNFELSTEQVQFQDSINRFLASNFDFAKRSEMLAKTPQHSLLLWNRLSEELGLMNALVPEQNGGLGGGPVDAMILLEAMGRYLVVDPVLETLVLGAGLLKRVRSKQASDLLSAVCTGQARPVFAWSDPQSRFSANCLGVTARKVGNEWILNGTKNVVVGADTATHLILSARTSDGHGPNPGVSLFLVPRHMLDHCAHPYRTMDAKGACDFVFKDLHLPENTLIGEEHNMLSAIEAALDDAAAGLCAEAVGAMDAVVKRTVSYTRDRAQFGAALSEFQALQHRMVDMFMATELARSATLLATLRLDAPAAERIAAVAGAKTIVSDSARFIGQNAVQLHGGMGTTDELDIGHYFRRLTAIETEFGDQDHHIGRYLDQTRAVSN